METNNLNKNLFAPIPGNNPVPVQDTTVSPYKFVGLLRMTFPSGREYIATGNVIAKGAEKDSFYVLTCAHNLYALADGGQAVKVEFIRAYNNPNQPFPSIEAVSWHYPPDYAYDINLDYGIVKLKSSVNSVDGFPEIVVKTSQELQDLAVQINGYGWYEGKMSQAQGLIKEVGDNYLRYPISTRAVAAGSAIIKGDNKEIVGIHTRGYNDRLNQGVRITESVKKQILGWMI